MLWTILKKCIVLLIGIHFCFSQTYVVKFTSETKDSTEVYSRLISSLPKGNSTTTFSSSVSITTFTTNTRSQFPWSRYAIIRFSKQASEEVIQSIAQNPSVAYIHPSYRYRVHSTPNDSAYSAQWNLRRIGIAQLWESGVIHSAIPSVKVGVIDTGIDTEHPDLVNALAINTGEIGMDSFGNDKRMNGVDDDNNGFVDDWRGYDFVEFHDEDLGDWNVRDNDPTDENGHGTAVSGIIGSQSNNSIGITGILPCKILPLRAFGQNGNGSDIDIASAIVYAVDNDAAIINMSFGDVIRSPLLYDAIRYAYEHNVVLVASSGNDGSSAPHYPSDFSEVISVGAVNRFDVRSFFSSHSPSLDLMAPGEQISTTTLHHNYTNNFSGTSAAAPHVSGIIALLKSIEQQKKSNDSQYVFLSNEELRGVLVNSADDAGDKGWDEFYGAGIVNAQKAIQAVSGSTVVIHSPALDELLTTTFSNIVVTAVTPYLKSVSLFYGRGEQPSEWRLISHIDNRILIRDTIEYLEQVELPDDVYILRLVVSNSKGNDVEYRQRVLLHRNAPKVLMLRYRDSVIAGSEYGALIEARVDRNCFGYLYYKKSTDLTYTRMQSVGLQHNHSFLLTTKNFQPNAQYQVYLEFVENSSVTRSTKFYLTDSLGSLLVISPVTISTTGFERKEYSLPAGFVLNSVQHINNQPTVILNAYNTNGDFGLLKAFSFLNGAFVQRDSSQLIWIPRAFTKDFVLVQDRGTSQLLKIDTTSGSFFSSPVWGDSTDVWASQLVDLNNDGLPEIIARNSDSYLVYENKGNNNFTLATRLPNPSFPLMYEARNQFGPPRALIGDFTGTGRKEIVFADYDGDLVMYRQTVSNSLNFALVGIDSSELFEMSDFLATGDFNGDGIQDIAVAGHSNLDLNADREYDTPVWTVRIFSHRASDPIGSMVKIWEQHFVGSKAGNSYDNGVICGKLRTSDVNDVLILSLNPYLYIFRWNNTTQTFESVWCHSSQSNSAIVFDFDGDGYNEIGFHTNRKTEFWSLKNPATSVQAPWNLSAVPLSERAVKLSWNSAFTSHNVYRGVTPNGLVAIASVNGTEWVDSTVTANTKYYFAVTALASQESQFSQIVSVIPHAQPVITNVTQVSHNQITVELSFTLSSDNLMNALFMLDDTLASSSVIWRSSNTLLVTFPQPIISGNRRVKIKRLLDASGMLADTSQTFSFVAQAVDQQEFFARSAVLESNNTILVTFSDSLDFTRAKVLSHYSVKNVAKNFTISRIDSISPSAVRLVVSPNDKLTDVALRLEVSLSRDIRSHKGVQLLGGKGQFLSIALETQDLNRIVVYPNPIKKTSSVSFVNIPSGCRITVYSTTGEKIKSFDELTTTEGITWNLRDERGNALSSGIYLFRVEKLDASGSVTHTTIGKFAVIR